MKKVKIITLSLFMFMGFTGAALLTFTSTASAMIMNMFKIPGWLVKLIIQLIIDILTHIMTSLRAAPVGSTTEGEVNLTSILNDENMKAQMGQSGVNINDNNIEFTYDMPVAQEDDWGVVIPAGSYDIDANGRCILTFKKISLPTPTFPDPFPPED